MLLAERGLQMTGAKTSACVRKPLTTFAMSISGELYLRAKGLLLH